jgi:hypothetical protein
MAEVTKGTTVSLLEMLIVIVLVMWLLGVTSGVLGNFIHVLILVLLVLVLMRLLQGRRTL